MLLLLAFTGCQKDTAGEKEKQTDETTPEIVLVDDGSGYTPPDVTYDGYNFRAIVRGFYKWACQDIFSEGYTGEGINDAVFTRNAYVEDLLDIEITQQAIETDAGLYNTIGRSVRAGDDAFDMMWVGSAYITQLAMDGVLTNLNSIESLDLSYEWWDQRAVENMTLDDAIFFTTGDMSIISNQATYVIAFNKTLTEDYGLENPYELVNGNKWTVDKFGQMAESLYEDLNGNGQYDADDRYGFMTYNADNMGFLLSAGGSIAKVDNDTLTTGYHTEPVIDMLTKLAAIKNQRSTFYFLDDDTATRMFTEGRTLFSFRTLINLGAYRDMETNYGILPTPKLNEMQEDYYCGVHGHGLSLIGTPITSQDNERTGVILQTMGQKSRQVLTPAFYEKTLKGKYFQDEESGAMLDIIFNSRVYDIGYFCNWGGIYDELNTLSMSAGDSFASAFASVAKKVQADMEKTVSAFGDIEITAQSILRDVEEKKAQQITEEDMEDNDYVIGTLAAASGELDSANTTRITMEAYIPIRQLKEVNVGSAYELTWLAYGADKTYIGNGNPEKKGNWIGAGKTFTAEEILAAYPEAAYVRFAMRKPDNSELK
ncbi:MAG: extracellular solute-binding protein, partial [Clostridia bacterium]|nr:extracellular solute-binding protein [Clostridia bacterium]